MVQIVFSVGDLEVIFSLVLRSRNVSGRVAGQSLAVKPLTVLQRLLRLLRLLWVVQIATPATVMARRAGMEVVVALTQGGVEVRVEDRLVRVWQKS